MADDPHHAGRSHHRAAMQLLLAAGFVMVMAVFGYTVGRDMARRDAAAAPAVGVSSATVPVAHARSAAVVSAAVVRTVETSSVAHVPAPSGAAPAVDAGAI